MYPIRLFSKLPSPKRLAYEEFEEFSIENEDRNHSVLASTSRLAFVTTRAETGGGSCLSASELVRGITENHFNSFDLSPPKAIQQGRKRNPASALRGGDTVPESRKNEQLTAVSPLRAAKRRTKLVWQSRASPDKQKDSQHGRSPSLNRIPFDYPRLDAAPDAVAGKSLRQSASFPPIGCKESGFPSVKLGQGNAQRGGLDNMPSTPRGSRKSRNSELSSSITSSGLVTSATTPRSASRSQRHGGRSSTSNALAAAGLPSTRATGVEGSGVRAFFQNQLTTQLPTDSRFQLEVDPTFWQDHNVQVLIRTRPINVSEVSQHGHGRCVKQDSAHTITWSGQPETRFTFDHVAAESVSQEELFRVAGLPMVENCLAGYNSCMFAYGQTGSGKTHTMLGDVSDLHQQPSENRGMTPRVFESLFTKIKLAEEVQKHENLKFKCRCTFLEIYNEQIVDLLEASSSSLQMREDASKGVYVEGLLEVEVQNVQDVLHLLLLGATNRRVAATNMNKESSRSHSVFTCTIESEWECDDMINFRFCRLNLVDLAGSERCIRDYWINFGSTYNAVGSKPARSKPFLPMQRASGAEGERLKEAASINKSLSTLGLVIMVLVDTANGKHRHVPYRDSKLTFLLQDSLGGNSKTTIIANISPSSCASMETLSTLKFAQRAKFIQNNAVINEDTTGDVNALHHQVQQLKDELARLRRQSISRIPTGRASAVLREVFIDEDYPSNSKEGLNKSIEGSFCHFGRTLQSPTVLNKKIQSLEAALADALRREQAAEFSLKKSAAEMEHLTRLVKQREEETQCCKMVLRFREDKIKRMEALSDGGVTADTYLVEETNAALKELQLLRNEKDCNPEVTKFAMENMRLQEQLRKFQDFRTSGGREVMAQEISILRDQLTDVLDSKLSLDSFAHSQNNASAVELAAEQHLLGLLRTEVESYRRELDGCRTSLSACLTSNDDMRRQLTELRKELEDVNESCSKYEKDLQDAQSEEKTSEEARVTTQLENLQANGALETAEMLLKKLPQNQVSPVVEVNRSLEAEPDQVYVINQLLLELGEVKATLEDERIRARELEEQLTDYGKQERRSLERVISSASHDSVSHARVRHQDAILQLQLELDTIDAAPESDIWSYSWEKGKSSKNETGDVYGKHSLTTMQFQQDLESVGSKSEEERRYLRKVEASRAPLHKQLEESVSVFCTEREAVLRLESCRSRTEIDLDTLRIDRRALLEKFSKAEEEENLKLKVAQLEWTLDREQEPRTVKVRGQSKHGPVDHDWKAGFNTEVKRATEGSHNFNCEIQGERSYRSVLKQEVQIMRPEVELKAALRNASIPLELSELRDEVTGAMEREAASWHNVTRLSDLLNDKEDEIFAVQQEWEFASAKLIDYLAAGKLSIDAACSKSTLELFGTSISRGKRMADRMVCKVLEEQAAVMTLLKHLQDARNLADSFQSKLDDKLDTSSFDCSFLYNSNDLEVKQSLFQTLQDSMALKKEVESCEAYLREVESKFTIAFIVVWWLSETAGLRCFAEDKLRIELTEAAAKIQERRGVLFSLQLELVKTPEKESREIHLEAERVHRELAAWEEERIRLAAKNKRFETQVEQIEKILEHLHLQLQNIRQRLQRATERLSEIDKTQRGLVTVKEKWNLNVSGSKVTVVEAELQCMQIKKELCTTKVEIQGLEVHTRTPELREEELQNEKSKLETEVKHLEAVQALADDSRNQEQENLRLKEQMAEQYEDWVLERSDLLVATREAESRCTEKNKAITSLQRSMARLQGQVAGAGYKPRLQNAKINKLVEGEVGLQLEDQVEELNEEIDRLTAENMELRNENSCNKIEIVAQKEVESSAVPKELPDAEEHHRQAESSLSALTQLVGELSTSEKSWLSEKELLSSEVEKLQSCLETLKVKFQTTQKERNSCMKRLAEMDENKDSLGHHAISSLVKGTKNAHMELRKAHAAQASSEEKLKLLTETVSTMGEDWVADRQIWISEKKDLQIELAKWEQHSAVRRCSDQSLRTLCENRSLPAHDAPDIKNVGKLRQELEMVRTENAKICTRLREQDQAYLSVREGLSAALAKREDLEVEMDRFVTENRNLHQSEEDLRTQLEAMSLEMTRRHAHIRSCESELQRLTMLQLKSEEQMNAAEQEWREEIAKLEAEREKSRVEANEKRNEAAGMLAKFEEWKATLREADSMVNALVRVNEKAKERWKREKERLASIQSEETNEVMLEMLQAVALSKEQADLAAGLAESEIRALVAETQIMRLDMTHEILKLKGEISGKIHENSKPNALPPSAKCTDSERQSWAHQVEAVSVEMAQKEGKVCALQVEVDKARKQIQSVQTLQSGTQSLLQEKDKLNLKLVNELNHLNQSMNRDRTLRHSLTRDVDDVISLRRSFSCKAYAEKDNILTILKEEQVELKSMVFNLEVENAELQEQLLEAETEAKTLESTIERFQKSDALWIEEVRLLEEQLEESARQVNELESHRMELRDEMQRQAASFAELYEHLQKQEGALEGEARAIADEVAAENEVLHTLQEEKTELKIMVELLDAELTVCETMASCPESSQAELERLHLEMERLQNELLRVGSLQKELDMQDAKLDDISVQRTLLEVNLAAKNKELIDLAGELESKRMLAGWTAHESEELKAQFEKLLEKATVLEEEVTRKRTAMKALQAELMTVEETMARFLEDASVDLKELEIERDNLHTELVVLTERLQVTQALADEQTAIADEARQSAELSRMSAEEKQVEAEILGRSVVELENTVYALESQLGLLRIEGERQRLMREDMEMELQGLNNQMSEMQGRLEESTSRSADVVLEAQFSLHEAERKLEEKNAEMQLAQKNLTVLLKDSEIKSEKIRNSKTQIAALLAEAQKKVTGYDVKLKAVESKLGERFNSQSSIVRGPKLKKAWSTFACIGKGYQMNTEVNASRKMYERRIQDLEIDLSNKQYEISVLTGKLEAAERMPTEVFQDLLGVKPDVTIVAQEQNDLQAQEGPSEKDEEVEHILQRLNGFIEEREGWLVEISRRHYDLLTAQVTIDELREREQVLRTDIEIMKGELECQLKIVGDLEQEVKKLSGQQNLQQRIKHHAKIKDENNLLRIQNDELSGKLRRSKLLHARVSDELAKYRTAEGKTLLLNFDEEHRLRSEVQGMKEQNAALSQKLGAICTEVVEIAGQALGVVNPSRNCEPDVALDALLQLRCFLESTQKDLDDYKLKLKIVEEKQKLKELRIVQSPLKDIRSFGSLNLAPR